MHPTLREIFRRFDDFEIAITGSAVRDFDAAHDIDVLFPASQDFRKLADELGVKYRGGFDTPQGRIHSLRYDMEGIEKEVNLIQSDKVEYFKDWAHAVLLRGGKILNEGKFFDKSALPTIADTDVTAAPVTDEEILVPKCCWCGADIILDGKIAWCSGSEECRQRQMNCGCSITEDGETIWLFVPSPKQAECMMAAEPNVFVVGNRGGGKSIGMRWLCHQLACAIPGFRYAILRTSFPELMKNHLIYLEDEMNRLGGAKGGFSYHKTDHICYYPRGSVGFYAQCTNDADVKKILGAEVALVVFDEAPTFEWEHMRLIVASIRVPAGSGLRPMTRYLGNPIGESIDELWKYFVDKDVSLADDPEYNPNEWRAIEMHVQDNPYLNAKEYWKQFAGLPKHYRMAWKEGVRVEENSLFEFTPSRDGKPYHVIHEIPRIGDNREPLFTVHDGVYKFPEWVRIYRAYDHGFWPDPAVCLWFAVFGRRILCFKEMTWFRTLAPAIAREIKQESRGMRVVTTYCDPSIDIETGADVYTIKQKMENAGVPMDCSVNNREFFADAIHSGLDEQITESTPRLQFLAGAATNTVKYLPRMKFDERNPAAMAAHKHDHWIVALAYFLMAELPNTKPQSSSHTPRRMQLPKHRRGSSAARVIERVLQRYGRT